MEYIYVVKVLSEVHNICAGDTSMYVTVHRDRMSAVASLTKKKKGIIANYSQSIVDDFLINTDTGFEFCPEGTGDYYFGAIERMELF